jgi:hypothetical protein
VSRLAALSEFQGGIRRVGRAPPFRPLSAVYAGEVEYTRSGLAGEPGATNFNLQVFPKGETSKAVAADLDSHHRALYFLKLLEWESEHEYRRSGPGLGCGWLALGVDAPRAPRPTREEEEAPGLRGGALPARP